MNKIIEKEKEKVLDSDKPSGVETDVRAVQKADNERLKQTNSNPNSKPPFGVNNQNKKTKNKSKGKKRKNNGKKSFQDVGDSKGTKANLKTGSVENANSGQVASSTTYEKPEDSNKTAESPQATNVEQALDVIDLRRNATVDDKVSDARMFNNQIQGIAGYNTEKVDLHRIKSTFAKVKELLTVYKKKLMLSPKTTVLPYSFEEYNVEQKVYNRMVEELLTSTAKYNIGMWPEIINVAYVHNVAGYGSWVYEYNRLNVVLKDKTFSSDPDTTNDKMQLLKADAKESDFKLQKINNPEEQFKTVKNESEKSSGLIRSYIPKGLNNPQGDLNYKKVDFELPINKNKSSVLPTEYVNDVGSVRFWKSIEQFIANLTNITLNDPEWEHLRGLSRNYPEVIHFVVKLIQARTFIEILFYCITEVQNRAKVIAEKLGYVDVTLKHVIASKRTSYIQDSLKTLAAYFSEIPYDKRNLDQFKEMTKWGKLNDLDPYHELNSIINVVAVIAGRFHEAVELRNAKSYNFRDNVAAPNVEIVDWNIIEFILSRLVKFFDYQQAHFHNSDYDGNNLPAYNNQLKGANDAVEYENYFSVSPTRMTSGMCNFLETLSRPELFFPQIEEYFRRSAQFFKLFKAKGLFDGTDFMIDTCNYPILGEITNAEVPIFDKKSILKGMYLGENYSQIELVTNEELDKPDFVPSWRLFIEYGKDKANYSNLINFICVKEKKKYKVTYGKNITNSFMDDSTKINLQVESFGLADATIIPFLPTSKSIMGGWAYGSLLRGEVYEFDSGVVDKKDYVQFYPVCFEWAKLPGTASYQLNQNPSAPVLVNHPTTGYYITQSLTPFLKFFEKEWEAKFAIFSHNDWNFLPKNWFIIDQEHKLGMFIKDIPTWNVTVAQLFWNNVFKGLHPLARGRSFNDLPTLSMCKLGEDD